MISHYLHVGILRLTTETRVFFNALLLYVI
jgi:hypothetical protein